VFDVSDVKEKDIKSKDEGDEYDIVYMTRINLNMENVEAIDLTNDEVYIRTK